MPKVTEAHLEARRSQIVEAAAACFARRGFHQCTMNDICAEAQLSPGAVYRYFSSKEEIIQAMAEESRARIASLIENVKSQGGPPIRLLDQLADIFFAPLDDPGCRPDCAVDIEVWAEAVRNPAVGDVLVRIIETLREPFARIVRDAQERGDINPRLDADSAARLMISAYYGLLMQKALQPDVDVWHYVTAMKAMMGGFFWFGQKLERED